MSRFIGRCFLAYGSLALTVFSLSVKAEEPEKPLSESERRVLSSVMQFPVLDVIPVAANAGAQARLRPPLSDDQKARIADLAAKWRDSSAITVVDFNRPLSAEEHRAVRTSVREKQERELRALVKELEKVLKAPQFQQLKVIAAGIRLRPDATALADPQVAAAVAVSDDSQKKVAIIVEAFYRKLLALLRVSRGADEERSMRAKLVQEKDLEIDKVLSDKEKALVQKATKAAEGIELHTRRPRQGQPAGSGAP